MKRGLRITLILIIILGSLAVMARFAYIRYKDKLSIIGKRSQKKLDVATPVAVYKVGRGSIKEMLTVTGEIQPKTEVNIFSTVPGKVKKIAVKEGQKVINDQILLYIDRSEAGLVYAPAPVKSTIEGSVGKIMVEVGAYITPQLPLVQLINIDDVEVVVHVQEQDIAKVHKGMKAILTVISYPKKKFYGKVTELSPVVDPITRTLEVKILVHNKTHILKPGMFGDIKLVVSEEHNVVIIPISSIVARKGKNVVYVVDNGIAREVNLSLGIREGERISIHRGILSGEKIVVKGQQNLNNGDKVRITEVVE